MKTTSYETSKQLAEAGFKADFDYCYKKEEPDQLWNKSFEITCWEGEDISNYYPSYDLETILDALPSVCIEDSIEYYFWLWNNGMGYYPNYDKYSSNAVYDMDNGIFEFSQDESLADTAAILWLKLKKKI